MKTLLLLLLLAPTCFAAEPSFLVDAIYLGQATAPTGETWKSVVEWRGDTGRCTGIFIENDVILTAAHCAPNLTRWADISVRFYKGTTLDHIETRQGGDFVLTTHPRFRENTVGFTNYDVAVIVFRDPIVKEPWHTVGFMTSDYNSLADEGHKVLMVGAGGVSQTRHTYDDGVRFTNAVIESYNGATITVRGVNGSGICYGDSGGPLLVPTPEGYRVLGVLSGFFPIGNCANSAFYTYLGATAYDWIQGAETAGRAKLNM